MKVFSLIVFLWFFFSCSKSSGPATRLTGTISTDNYDSLLHTEYGYDNQGRIITITQYKNNAPPEVAVTVRYSGDEAILLSFPQIEPAYNQTTEVHLTLEAGTTLLKRIEYTLRVAKSPAAQPDVYFRYDTLLCEYDAAGFLKSTTRNMYDSTWVNATYSRASRLRSVTSYTTDAGNLIASDEYATYPVTTRNGGTTTITGGTSEYHKVFTYAKSYPNQADLSNAAVLNEYILYYEPSLNNHYKNLPDHVTMQSTDRDQNGTIIFTGNSTIEIERLYNTDGLLSMTNILSRNTPYSTIKYFYGR